MTRGSPNELAAEPCQNQRVRGAAPQETFSCAGYPGPTPQISGLWHGRDPVWKAISGTTGNDSGTSAPGLTHPVPPGWSRL